MGMLPFHQVVEDEFKQVNQLIIEQLHSDVALVNNIGQYLVDAGGKRLRPLLVLLTTRALGYRGDRHYHLAAVIEFIHTATLLHDDVVDTSDLRRGRATANAKWGNAPSVLVGDFLYSRAFQLLVAIGNMRAMEIISYTSNVLAEGEVQQLVNAGNPDIDEAAYNETIRKKTAQLFEAATHSAAVLSEASEKQQAAMQLFGHHLGMAFQLVDDVLDYRGDATKMGKNVGDDLAEGKPTLPMLYAMNKCGNSGAHQDDVRLIRDALIERNTDKLAEVVAVLNQTGALDYCEQLARGHVAEAQKLLSTLPESSYKKALVELSDFAIDRAS